MSSPLAEELYDFRNILASKGIVFNYSGYVTEDILTSIGKALREKLALEGEQKRTAQRLFSIFVEQMQNIIRYSAETAEKTDAECELPDLRYGLLSVGAKEGRYFISCCNLVEKSDALRLGSALREVAEMDRDALKKAYKQTLRSGPPKGSKGAGIGFIEIARQCTAGFEFGFKDLDDGKSYFCLKAYV